MVLSAVLRDMRAQFLLLVLEWYLVSLQHKFHADYPPESRMTESRIPESRISEFRITVYSGFRYSGFRGYRPESRISDHVSLY